MTTPNPYRNLPQVGKVLEAPELAAAKSIFPADAVANAVRAELIALRSDIQRDATTEIPAIKVIAERAAERLALDDIPLLRSVINATGVVLHTNLGRSPMAEEAALAAYDAARSYLNLELDLATGKRSSRQDAVRAGLCTITGAESATAVNNCAAATVLVLRALAAGKEVIVSRGQLIEIGGSFRIPEIMAASGATLKEVGTTNITRLSDYEQAISPNTGLIMRVHASNYRVRGFTQSVPLGDLVELGRKHKLSVIDDAGSGAMMDFSVIGLPGEPVVPESIRAGADLVLFSGDKLLGGPQAGLIVGKAELIRRIEADPLMRAFRLDKMTLAALEATVWIHQSTERIVNDLPLIQMLTVPIEALRRRCENIANRLRLIRGLSVEVRTESAFVGGGSLPDVTLPTVVVALTHADVSEETLAMQLRTGLYPVVARIQKGEYLLDLRTVFDWQEDDLVNEVRDAVERSRPG